ncbi:MAG: recombinase family protein, partial [Firmicutes bacterium]|nr:recombinase family protein [Bacillota bacterium]
MKEDRPLAIYSRKSRSTDRGESIENQVEMCRRHLAVRFGAAAASRALVYEDEGFSGGNLERPRFKLMMSDALRRPFRAIDVYRLDRISRNLGDFARLIQ